MHESSTADLFRGLLATDAILFKAAGIVEETQFRAIERRLFVTLGKTFFRRARAGVKAATSTIARGEEAEKFRALDVERALNKLEDAFAGWGEEAAPLLHAAADESYRSSKRQLWQKLGGRIDRKLENERPNLAQDAGALSEAGIAKAGEKKPRKPRRARLNIEPSFDQVDEDAIEALTRNQVFWIGSHYADNLSQRLSSVVNETMLRGGLGRRDAAKELERVLAAEFGYDPNAAAEVATPLDLLLGNLKLPAGWRGSSAQYLSMVAANVATTGRVQGAMRAMEQAGLARYEIVNPLDERTCARCNFMNGKQFTVSEGVERVAMEVGAPRPDAVRGVHPWANNVRTLREAEASPSGLMGSGFALPPFHGACFPADVPLQGSFVGGSRAFYRGKAVELMTREGRRLTVTANHPVLTSDGMVAACALREGDQLICYQEQAGISSLRGGAQRNEDQQPARAENVFRALAQRSPMGRFVAAPDNFHGEARSFDGEIDVVGSYRELLTHDESTLCQQCGDLIFEVPAANQSLVPGPSGADLLVTRRTPTFGGGPRGAELTFDGGSVSFAPLHQLSIGTASQLDTRFSENAREGGAPYTKFVRKLFQRAAGQVSLDEVIEIREFDFSGHVHDFETATGWIVASGIFTSNCRCTVDVTEDLEFASTEIEREFPWKEAQLQAQPMRLAGMHRKVVYRAPDGSLWMFKPQDRFRALGDVASARIAERLGLQPADTYLVELGGETGSIQRMFAGVEGPIRGMSPSALTEAHAHAIQREHIFDWLISQHDTHDENILRLENGELRFIDKGQLFRFFGQDTLDLRYGAPGLPNPSGTYYHELFNAYARGENVALTSLQDLEPFLQQIESIPDDEFVALLRPYAQAAQEAASANPSMRRAAWMGRYTEDEFLAAVLERKQNIRRDLTAFYEEIEKARDRTLGPADVRARLRAWTARLEEASDPTIPGWRGRSFFVRGNDYEGMNWLIHRTRGDGTFLETKLRSAGHRKLMAFLDQANGAATPMDPFHDDVLKIAKSFNFHLKEGGSGVVPPHTEERYTSLLNTLRAAEQYADDPAHRRMARHYLDYLNQLGGPGSWNRDAVGRAMSRYALTEADLPRVTGLPQGWSVDKVNNSDPILRRLVNGEIEASPATGATHSPIDRDATIFRVRTPQGATVYYHPQGADSQWAVGGRMRVWIDAPIGNLSPRQLDDVFQSLNEIGLETTEAAREDLDLLYLRKVAFKHRLDEELRAEIAEDLPVPEQITRLRAALAQRKRRLPDRLPDPIFDAGRQSGWARWSDATMSEADTNFVLHHSLSDSPDEFLERVLGGQSGGLVSTVERYRNGIARPGESITGMSPLQDLRTGGANYVFTRVRPIDHRTTGLQFRGEMLRDLDAITYDGDRYGSTEPTALAQRLAPTASNFNRMANRGASDETIFKNGLALDNLQWITVGSSSERTRVLEVFRRHNVTHLGGRPVTEIVRSAY